MCVCVCVCVFRRNYDMSIILILNPNQILFSFTTISSFFLVIPL